MKHEIELKPKKNENPKIVLLFIVAHSKKNRKISQFRVLRQHFFN